MKIVATTPSGSFNVDANDVEVALTFSIQDLENPIARRGAFSKTITLPSTDNNDALFGHAYNLQSFFSGYDSSQKIDVSLWDDGVQIMKGVMRLLMVKKVRGNISYEVGIYGDEVSLFKEIDGKLLTDLDLSDLDHSLTSGLVIESWTSGITSGFVYGLVDSYGYTDVRPNFGASATIVPYNTLTPSVFSKQYVDRIFSAAGFRYSSTFLNSAQFAKEVVPYPYDTIQQDLNDYRAFIGLGDNQSGESINTASGVLAFDQDSPAPLTNTSATNYDVTTFSFTNYANGVSRYRVVINGFFNINTDVTLSYGVYDSDTNTQIARSAGRGRFMPSGSSVLFNEIIEVGLNPSQRIDVRVLTTSYGSITSLLNTSTILYEPISVPLGANVDMNTAIPEKVTQADFLVDLKNRYNLMFYAAPDDPKLLYIEPYKDFFNGGTVDWTEKVDENSEFEIVTGDPSLRREFVFSYASAGDSLNKLYQDNYSEVYGTGRYITDNYYAKQSETITLKCAQVIPASYTVPMPIGRTFNVDANGQPQPNKAGYRIAQYNLVAPPVVGVYWYLFRGTNILDPANYIAQTSIPLVATIDNPYNPTFDLCYDVPRILYYAAYNTSGSINYTSNNLLNTYWKGYIDEIASEEAMQVSVDVVLNAVDIASLDFRKLIYLHGILWKLVEISDFVLGGTTKSRVTLRRVLKLPAFSGGQIPVNANSTFQSINPLTF